MIWYAKCTNLAYKPINNNNINTLITSATICVDCLWDQTTLTTLPNHKHVACSFFGPLLIKVDHCRGLQWSMRTADLEILWITMVSLSLLSAALAFQIFRYSHKVSGIFQSVIARASKNNHQLSKLASISGTTLVLAWLRFTIDKWISFWNFNLTIVLRLLILGIYYMHFITFCNRFTLLCHKWIVIKCLNYLVILCGNQGRI